MFIGKNAGCSSERATQTLSTVPRDFNMPGDAGTCQSERRIKSLTFHRTVLDTQVSTPASMQHHPNTRITNLQVDTPAPSYLQETGSSGRNRILINQRRDKIACKKHVHASMQQRVPSSRLSSPNTLVADLKAHIRIYQYGCLPAKTTRFKLTKTTQKHEHG